MNREYHRWHSHRLQQTMELLVFGHSGARVIVFPTREGRFYDYENWGLVQALAPTIEAGNLQLYCVDSVDSQGLYCHNAHPRARIERQRQFELYITTEVIPFIKHRAGENAFLIAHGCSIGAYHAVNVALRRPELFGKVVALSGRYDLTRAVGPFTDLFNGYYDEDIYFHTPLHFLPQLNDPARLVHLRRMDITLAVGIEDPFCQSTRDLSYQLTQKQVPNRLVIWDGEAHRPRYWRQMVKLYL